MACRNLLVPDREPTGTKSSWYFSRFPEQATKGSKGWSFLISQEFIDRSDMLLLENLGEQNRALWYSFESLSVEQRTITMIHLPVFSVYLGLPCTQLPWLFIKSLPLVTQNTTSLIFISFLRPTGTKMGCRNLLVPGRELSGTKSLWCFW